MSHQKQKITEWLRSVHLFLPELDQIVVDYLYGGWTFDTKRIYGYNEIIKSEGKSPVTESRSKSSTSFVFATGNPKDRNWRTILSDLPIAECPETIKLRLPPFAVQFQIAASRFMFGICHPNTLFAEKNYWAGVGGTRNIGLTWDGEILINGNHFIYDIVQKTGCRSPEFAERAAHAEIQFMPEKDEIDIKITFIASDGKLPIQYDRKLEGVSASLALYSGVILKWTDFHFFLAATDENEVEMTVVY